MKYLKPYRLEAPRYLFFQAPTDGDFGPPEWHDPERNKKIALKKLCDLRALTPNDDLHICLQFLESFIADGLDFEITDNDNLKNFFIERLHSLDIPTLVSEITRAFTRLNTREDFDLTEADAEIYFSGFIICWIELSQS